MISLTNERLHMKSKKVTEYIYMSQRIKSVSVVN
ncbi:hypothetical protein BDFB_015226 [Asbolus verrucosus]|uniref:Uncharacterized protein n=1 Tax=Asbolus verrucosus TaxID=1661398 RepID=A0A482VU01_ASBVE|nr:hypothetical protein BDFB_015226 [Asbolus verrucosus]